ncbi:DUF3489 domain-containing protein [Qipengyuania sp. DGS5-3]|uniref:DUF3489 domain-containing protein n=1 Tax=Qipengyuania sp. DGS5-3 TaxID=3349632 RepID=UPI0036D24B26
MGSAAWVSTALDFLALHWRPKMTTIKKTKRRTKSAMIARMLNRAKGATLTEIQRATGWKPHSCRAFLSGVRKQGSVLVKEVRPDGSITYKITSKAHS